MKDTGAATEMFCETDGRKIYGELLKNSRERVCICLYMLQKVTIPKMLDKFTEFAFYVFYKMTRQLCSKKETMADAGEYLDFPLN